MKPASDGTDADLEEAAISGRDESLSALLRGALREEPEEDPLAAERAVLRGVQSRLRERSGGRFYGLGWGSTPEAPFATYLVSAIIIVAVVALLFVTLRPSTGSVTKVPPVELRLAPMTPR